MENIEMEVTDNILTITIDLTNKGSPSKSGKSLLIASSGGVVTIPGNNEIKIGINCYTKAPA